MKKCPRCGKEIHEGEKYCLHCGLDLESGYKKPRRGGKLGLYGPWILIFIGIFGIMFYQAFNATTSIISSTTETSALEDISEDSATYILDSYDTLADFQNAYSNASDYVSDIVAYEETLSDYTLNKVYSITVYDNYNIAFELDYSVIINDNLTLKINRSYDRAHSYNDETITLKKTGLSSFDELLLTADELAIIQKYHSDTSTIETMISNITAREEEFESKKETLGHYGLGEYEDGSSYVIHRNGTSYYIIVKDGFTADDYIS
ncbi:MAG: zinc ribbon domain-containing protein [Erysipelotrichaceae bacterium]|nr:zinc ribbon domain-containing protein [Erysipelotrichaceae bacterium]